MTSTDDSPARPRASPWLALRSIKRLDAGLCSREDNFLLLRLLAASLVIYRHGGALTGGAGYRDIFENIGPTTDSGKIAVDIFFLVSGFMITGSYARRRHLISFLWARVLRIFPAYIFCLFVTSYVLGALYTKLSTGIYYHDPVVLHYVVQNMKMQPNLVWQLPGVFTDNPQRDTVNGSIWTLPAEVRMYLWVAILGVCGLLARRWYCTAIIGSLLLLGIARPDSSLLLLPDIYLHIAAMFALGALCYLNRKIIPVGWPCFAVLIGIAFMTRNTAIYPLFIAVSLAQFCFSFAYCIPWLGFNRFGDYSYGTYLWGFPVQQVIAHHFPSLSPVGNSLISFPLALSMGILSWHVVEIQALKLKHAPGYVLEKWRMQRRHAK